VDRVGHELVDQLGRELRIEPDQDSRREDIDVDLTNARSAVQRRIDLAPQHLCAR